jgi:hypothetical protein
MCAGPRDRRTNNRIVSGGVPDEIRQTEQMVEAALVLMCVAIVTSCCQSLHVMKFSRTIMSLQPYRSGSLEVNVPANQIPLTTAF